MNISVSLYKNIDDMKIIRLFLIALTSLSLFSCDSNDKEIINGNQLSNLKQTTWKGTLINEIHEEIIDKGEVSITFLTENRGNSVVTKNGKVQKWDFKYTIDDRLLTIDRPDPNSFNRHFLEGDWLLMQGEKNRLIFVQGVNDSYSKKTMDIVKLY